MRRYLLDRLMNWLSLLLLLGTTVFLAVSWQRIPSEVPIHFNALGEIDRWGGKGGLLVLPVIGWAVYVLMTVVEHFPSLWNTGVQITVENRARVYRLLGHLLSTLKCLTTAMFAGLTLWCVLARPLPGWFLPVVLVVLFGDMIFWLVRVIRAR